MKKEQYDTVQEQMTPETPYFLNSFKAFLVGGLICVIGQAIAYFYMIFFDFTEKTVGNPTVATMILLAALATGLGIYPKIAQFAGAGSAVPVTGFSNAVVSAAIEHRTEGYVLGVGSNMFKIAGPVIVYGTVAAFFVAIIKTILVMMGVVSW